MRADIAKDDLLTTTAVHVERETARQDEVSTLRAFRDNLFVKINVLRDSFDSKQRAFAAQQEEDAARIIGLQERIEEVKVSNEEWNRCIVSQIAQCKVEGVNDIVKIEAAEVSRRTEELVTLRADVASLDTSNNSLFEKIACLLEAMGIRERCREEEAQSLTELLTFKKVSLGIQVEQIEC